MRKLISFITAFFLGAIIWSQNVGELKGAVTEEDGKTPIPFANVILEQSGKIINGQSCDIDGNFWLKNIQQGIYDVKFTSAGLPNLSYNNILIDSGKITLIYAKMKAGVTLKEYTVSTNKAKMHANVSTVTITRDDIQRIPSSMGQSDVVGALLTTPGIINSADNNQKVFVDGIKIQNGNANFDDSRLFEDEEYTKIVENRFTSPFTNPLSTFSIDVDKASYSNIRRMINAGILPDKNAIRLEEMINYFNYDYPQPTNEHPFSIHMESSTCPWNKDHDIISIGIQGKKIEPKNIPASNLVFLIDVSGSMSSSNKLPLVKSSLTALVKQLRPIDKVSIVVYAGAAGLVLNPTTGDMKKDIIDAIENLSAGGSTAGGAGIKLAYNIAEKNIIKEGNNRIILCTDGDFNVGVNSEADLEDLIVSERDKGIFLTVLGYGMGNYKDSKMEILADKGNGNYAYIDSQLEADKVLVKEMTGTLFTIAKDVKIQVEFNPALVKSYRLIGYENRVLQDWEFNDDTRDAGEIGAGHSVTAMYEIEYVDDKSKINEDLKYQKTSINTGFEEEVFTIKFRYKPPQSNTSILIEEVLKKSNNPFESASENLRFAATVAQFGMLLRNSEYKGSSTFDNIIEQAKKCKTFDEEGYRAEFINLVKASTSLVNGNN